MVPDADWAHSRHPIVALGGTANFGLGRDFISTPHIPRAGILMATDNFHDRVYILGTWSSIASFLGSHVMAVRRGGNRGVWLRVLIILGVWQA